MVSAWGQEAGMEPFCPSVEPTVLPFIHWLVKPGLALTQPGPRLDAEGPETKHGVSGKEDVLG